MYKVLRHLKKKILFTKSLLVQVLQKADANMKIEVLEKSEA